MCNGNATAQSAPKVARLMTYERTQLAWFIAQHDEYRERLLAEAVRNPRTAGPLIAAYRWAIANT